jgi:hypothetical protein
MASGPQTPIEAIERAFNARRRTPPDLPGAFDTAFAPLAPTLPPDPAAAMARAGRGIAAAMDHAAAATREPPYHNRHHAAEATLAMSCLCRAALAAGLITPLEAAIGVVAMVGHDMDHDGSTIGGGVLEARSWRGVRPIAAAELDPAALERLGDIILATDPAQVAQNAACLRGEQPSGAIPRGQIVLRVLANEADICASLLPRLGPSLSLLLAEEWRPSGSAALLQETTAAGRADFLRSYPPLSAPATVIGLEAARVRCLQAYVAVAAAAGGEPTIEAGCALLDAMPTDAAAAAYAAALG